MYFGQVEFTVELGKKVLEAIELSNIHEYSVVQALRPCKAPRIDVSLLFKK